MDGSPEKVIPKLPGLDNPGCVRAVRRMQRGKATEEDAIFLWEQTCQFLDKGIRSRVANCRDPDVGRDDVKQELFIRIKGWARNFPASMTSWATWARACWHKWILNHVAKSGRQRPSKWLHLSHGEETDFAHVPGDDPMPGIDVTPEALFQDLLMMLDKRPGDTHKNGHPVDKKFLGAARKFLALRVVARMSVAEALATMGGKWNGERFRLWEVKLLREYEPGMGRRSCKGKKNAWGKDPSPD